MPAFLTKLSTRISAIAVVALTLSVLLTVLLQSQMRSSAETLRNKSLLEITESAASLLAPLNARLEAGEISRETAFAMAREQLETLRFGETGYMFAFDTDYIMRAHPYRPQWIGENQQAVEDVNGVKIFEELKSAAVETGHGTLVYHFYKPETTIPEAKIGMALHYKPWDWVIGTGAYVADVEAEMALIRNKALTVLGVILIALCASAFFIVRSVTKPMDAVRARMASMAEGDTDSDIPLSEAKNELGDMARTLQIFRDALVQQKAMEAEQKAQTAQQNDVVQTLSHHLSTLSKGDLTAKIDTAFPSEYEILRTDFNASLDTLSQTITDVVDSSKSIHNGATEISHASDDLSQRTENQAATLEETAAALDDLTRSVKSTADGARDVESSMDEAKKEAAESGEVVRSTVTAMTEIEQSSAHISQIISVIDDIAFQTNLLALNAGVEAARAGDAGRGFAVVASEVRQLAQSSSEAANEIKSLISDSSKHVERGVVLVGQTGEALNKIVDRVVHVSEMVTRIAEGASEQSLSLGEINAGVTQLDQVTQKNAAMVEEATAATHLLKTDAASLSDLVTHFKLNAHKKAAQPAARPASAPKPAAAAKQTAAKPAAKSVTKDDWQDDLEQEQQEAKAPKPAKASKPAAAAPKPAKAPAPAPQPAKRVVNSDADMLEETWSDF